MRRSATVMAAAWVGVFLGSGCSSSGSTGGGSGDAAVPASCPIGDPTKPIEMQIVHRTVDGGIETTMDTVPLITPPQAGKVAFISVRAKNLDGCPVTISSSLRDPCDNTVIALQVRPIALEMQSDGYGTPRQPEELFNYLNLPVCPAPATMRNLQGEKYQLTVKITDKMNRSVEQTLSVTPVCAEPNNYNECVCECSPLAVLGAPCSANFDAGAPNQGCRGGHDGGP